MKITQKSKYQKVADCQYWSENISSIPLIEEICIFLYIFVQYAYPQSMVLAIKVIPVF